MQSSILLQVFFSIFLISRSFAFLLGEASLRCPRSLSSPVYLLSTQGEDNNGSRKIDAVPFVIDRIGNLTSQTVFDDIAEMCIEVFFNDDRGYNNISPWKKLQLTYLRALQSSDLKQRKLTREARNAMFVARLVQATDSQDAAKTKPLFLDLDRIQNLETKKSTNYLKGEILGFVEVTERAYGLGEPYDNMPRRRHKQQSASNVRPILTNLAVKAEARKSGIGSQLVDACEQEVLNWSEEAEIILEVEIDNPGALEFYKKRDYEALFTDRACRRFSTEGFFLRKERCAKICMRKDLEGKQTYRENEEGDKNTVDFQSLIQKFRDPVDFPSLIQSFRDISEI